MKHPSVLYRLLSSSLLAAALLLGGTAACSNNPKPSIVAGVADVAAKLQASGNVILKSADAAATTPNPLKNGAPLVSKQQVDTVAVAVYKLGLAGKRLGTGLKDYNKIKAASNDPAALALLRGAIQQSIADATDALKDVGLAVPSGTVAAIDQAVADALGIIASIKAGGL